MLIFILFLFGSFVYADGVFSKYYNDRFLFSIDVPATKYSPVGIQTLILFFPSPPKYEISGLIKKDNTTGQASSRNLGLKKSRGKLIAFLDSDDIWDKYFFESHNFICN